jgi:site-specific DNA-methyltransferase (cytosine-N4-specific)
LKKVGISQLEMEVNVIHNEPCLETLRRMPDEFIDCVITSPPYYGLRSYGTEPQIWGNHNGCAHEWGKEIVTPGQTGGDGRTSTLNAKKTIDGRFATDCHAHGDDKKFNEARSNFCQHCNAWRGELGLEPTFQLFISHLIDIFREVKRVLKPTGTVWVNLGDSFNGSGKGVAGVSSAIGAVVSNGQHLDRLTNDPAIPRKSLMNIPARFAIAMTDELQFINRNHLIWHKPACMPSSAKDRFTVDFESIFFFTKSAKYWFEQQTEIASPDTVIRDRETTKLNNTPGRSRQSGLITNHYETRNMRTVWRVPFEPQSEEHYASYPTKLIATPIKAGCPVGGIVYDPFMGTGTSAVVAHKLGRKFIGSELNPKYADIATKRLAPILAQEQLFQ